MKYISTEKLMSWIDRVSPLTECKKFPGEYRPAIYPFDLIDFIELESISGEKSHCYPVEDRLDILAQTTLDDFPEHTLNWWIKEAVEKIRAQKVEINRLENKLDQLCRD